MAHVFISYAREDLDFAEQLANRLNRTGLSVWWDRRLLAGDDIEAEIDEQIQSCDAVIVVWSSTSLNSHWVKSEASAALALNKLVPVRSDDTRLPRPYDQIHTLDLSNWNGGFNKDIRLLFDSVRTISKGKKIRRGPGRAAGTMSKRRMFSIGALASAAVVGLAIVSDVTDLVGNLKGDQDEQELSNQIAQLDERLAVLSRADTPEFNLEETHLTEAMRRLQMWDVAVNDIVLAVSRSPKIDEVILTLDKTLSEGVTTLPPERRIQLLHQAAALAFETNKSAAESKYEAILDIEPDNFAALAALVRIEITKYNIENAREYARRAKLSPPPNRESQIDLDMHVAFTHYLGNTEDMLAAIDLYKDLLRESSDLGLTYQESAATVSLAMTFAYLNQTENAQTLLAQILPKQRDQSFHGHIASSLSLLGDIALQNGELSQATDHYSEWLELALKLQRPGYIAAAYNGKGRTDLAKLDTKSAEAAFTLGLTVARQNGVTAEIFKNTIGLAEVHLAKGDLRKACRFIQLADAPEISSRINKTSKSYDHLADVSCDLQWN